MLQGPCRQHRAGKAGLAGTGFFAWWFSPAWLKSVPLKEKDEAMGLTSVLDIEGLQLQLGKWDG